MLSLTTLFAFTGVFVVPRYALEAATPIPPVEAPAPSRPGEITFGIGVSDQEVSASLDTLFPLAVPKNGLLFLNPKLSGGDELDPRVSIGLGYRHLFEGSNVIVGGNIFYDCFDTIHNHRINQLGIGAEVLTRWVDFRANYYLPEQDRRTIGRTETVSLSRKSTSSEQDLGRRVTGQDLAFQGNNILQTTTGANDTLHTINLRETETTKFWERYESGMRGGDAEIGVLIPGLDRYADVRVFGGYYFYENDFGKDISGFKGRLEVRALPAVTLDAMYYDDKEVIGSNWFYGVRVSAPFDLANLSNGRSPFAGISEAFKPKSHTDDKAAFASRMTENIIRSSRVTTSESKFIKVREEKETYKGKATYITSIPFSTTEILTLGGQPITVTHVSSLVGGPGTGTFESPYVSLTLANADAVKRDIILLHANSVFTLQSISIVAGQRLLGDSAGVTHLIDSDQGIVALPHATAGATPASISNAGGTLINVSNNSVVSGLTLSGGDRGIYAAAGATGVTVTNSSISNMTTAGIEIKPSSGTTIDNVTFNSNATDVILNAFNTTIKNVTSNGSINGAFDLSNTTGTTTITNVVVNNAGNFAFRFTNPGGTHNITNLDITGGTGAGVLIVGGGGTFGFDTQTSITNTGSAAFTLQGGTANVTYSGTMTESGNVPLIAVLAGHTGTATFQTGTLNATNGQGLLFDNADGHYNFLGPTTLHGGDAGIDIVNGSDGTFTFAAGTVITNPTGQSLFVNGGTASVSFAGKIIDNTGAAVEVLNHTTGTISFLAASNIAVTGGTGLQFTNDNGIYNFLGTTTLNGGDAGIDILSSNGTFTFGANTAITNPTGTGFFLSGGQAKVTYSGNINDNSGFALQVVNHSVGTVVFNTGTVTSTTGLGVQFTNDSGIYGVAKVNVSNSAGAGVEVTASPTGTFTFGNVVTTTTAGPGVQLNNAGTVSVLGGSINGTGGNGIFSQNTALTVTGTSIGNNVGLNIAGIGIQVINNDGAARLVTLSNNNIRSTGSGIVTTDSGVAGELTLILNGNTLQTLAAGSKAMNITGSALNSTTIRSMNGGTVIGNGTGGGLLFNRVTFDSDSVTAGAQQVAGGVWNIGQGTSARVFNDGVHFDAPTGNLAFTTLNIFNNAGTGLFVDTKTLGTTFALGNTGGAINTTTGAAMNLDPLTVHLTFGSVTSMASGTSGIILDTLAAGSTLVIGTTSVSTSAGDGIVVRNSAGTNLNFGNTTVLNVGGDGIDLTNAGNATVIFGTTNINGFSTTGSGVNFAGSDVTATFGKTTIQNGGNGTGIDLSSTQNGRVITFLTGSSITNVAIGVQLSSSGTTATSANSNFQFGDGSGVDANGRNSIINAPTTVAAIGLNPASGTYNFQDVFFTGTAAFPAAPGSFFVTNQAITGGDGSFANPFGVQEADAITTTGITFAFLDGTYNFNTLNAGQAFSLVSGQSVTGLDNGNTVAYGTVQPSNISGNFGILGGSASRQLGGSLSITNGAAGSVFELRGTNNVTNITVTGEGGAIDPTQLFTSNGGAVGFDNTGGISLGGVTIGNLQAGSTAFDFTNMTGSVQISGNNISATAGTLLSINGGTAAYTVTKGSGTLTGTAVNIHDTTGGSVAVTGASLNTNGNTAVTLNGNAATTTFTNLAVTRTAGDTAFDIDATTASTGKVTVNGTSSLDSTAGTAFRIGAGARDIDASALNFNNAATTAANVISSTGQTGGTIRFGNVGITGYNSGAGTAVNLTGTGGSVVFGDLDIAATDGDALNVDGIGFTITAASTLSASSGRVLGLNNVTLGAPLTFASLSAAGSTTGSVAIAGMTGSLTVTGTTTLGSASVGQDALSITDSAGTFNFQGATTISGSNLDGILLSGANGAVTFGSIDINGTTSRGVDIDGATNNVTFNGGTIGATTAAGGFSIAIANQVAGSTIAFNTVSATGTSPDTVNLSANNGTVTFTGGTQTQTGTGDVLDIDSLGATGVVNFGSNLVHTGTGQAVEIDGSAGQVTVSGTISATGGSQIAVIGASSAITGGSITFSGSSMTETGGAGISIQNVSTPATVSFTGPVSITGSTGDAITVANSTGTTSFSSVTLATVTGNGVTLNSGGTVSILGGTINGTTADGVNSVNTNVTVSGVTMGATAAIAGDGIDLTNSSGTRTVAINNTTVTNATGAGIKVDGSLGGTTTITSLSGNTVTKAGAGGILVDTATFDADTATAGIQQVAGGNTTIGSQVTTTDVTGDGLRLDQVLGDIAFGTLNIGNDTGTGLYIRDAGGKGGTFAFGATGGAVNTTNGTALDIDPVAFNVTFSSVGSTNAATNGINLDTISGTANLGNISVTNATGAGVRLVGSSATVTAGTVTVNGAATGLLFGANTGGSFTASGATNLTNIIGTGINANAATGTYSFKALTVSYSGAGRGIDFRGSNVQFESDTTSVTGNGTAGSIAIDLSGTLNPNGANSATPNILLGNDTGETATISNVAVGVKMGEPGNSAGAYFRFGNQTPLNSGSSIAVIAGGTTLDTTNLTSTNGFTQGRYEFKGVAFTGSASFEASANFFFVAANATGSGDGSTVNDRANAATLITELNANLLANKTIVLINDGNVISLGNNSATLNTGTIVDGFGNGNSVAAFSIPVNVIIDTFTGTVADPTGNGAATLTANAGNNVITLTDAHSIKNINITGGDFLIAGNGFTGLTVEGTGLSGAGTGVFSFTNATGVTSITNNAIAQAGGRLLSVNGGTAGISLTAGTGSISNTSGSGISVVNTTGGSVTLTGVSVTGATATPLTFDNNDATFAITGSTFAANAGVTLLNVDTSSGGSTTALTFDNTNTLTHTSGTLATIGAGARNIDLSAFNFTNAGTTATRVISSVGQTGGTISFGNIGITGYNNAAGTAVSLAGTAGTVSFADLDVTTTSGAGVSVGAITFAPGSSSTISATGGTALSLSGTTLSGGAATFASVSATTTGGVAGISLANTVGTTTLTTVNINGTGAASGIVLNTAGPTSILGGSINGTGVNGIDSTNTALTATGLTIGATTPPTGNGVRVVNNDGTARVVTISNNSIKSAGDAIKTTDGGTAGELSLVLNGNTLETTGVGSLAMNIAGSALNSTTVNSFNGVTVTANGTGGGILFSRVTFDAVTGGAIQQVTGGTANIGQGTAAGQRVQGNGLNFQGPTGDIAFGTLNIFSNNGTGLLVNTKTLGTTFTNLSNTTGVLDTSNGAVMNLDPLTVNLTFTSVTSTNSGTSGVILDTVAGTLALGNVSVTSAAAAGLSMVDSSAAVTAGTVTVNGAATGLLLGANTGGIFTAGGTTSLTNITGTGIDANAATGTYSFQALTIGYSGAGRGIDFRGSNVQFESDTTSITGDGTAGSIAIDLSGTLNPNGANSTTPNILLGNDTGETASISNVAVGVKMGEPGNSAGAYFRFGNQTPLNSGSSIAVIGGGTTLDTTNLTSVNGFTQGRYEFAGVAFTGSASFQASANFFFVAANATGTGDGSSTSNRANGATLLVALGANQLANQTIVLINDGSAITIANTANLNANTNIDGFGNGNSVAAFTIPVNVIIDTFSGTVADPTGNGAATLTTGAGHNLISLNGTNSIQNVTLTGGDFLVSGTGITGLTVQGTTLTSGATGVFSVTNPTGTISITNNTISGGGRLLALNGGTAAVSLTKGTGTVANTGGSGISVVNTTGGSVTLTGVSVTGATATPLTFDNNDATFAITGSTFAANAGVTLLDVDTGAGGSTTALTFDNTNTLTHTSGTLATIGAGARNIDLSAFNFTNTGTTATRVISSVGQTGGTISFGNIGITGYNNAAGTAVSLAGTAGTVSFADLDVTTTSGAGVSVGAITFAPGSSSTISATGGTALSLSGTTLSGGAATFASVSATTTGGVAGISLANTVGTTTLTTVNINGTGAASGIVLNAAGPTSILGGSINGTGVNGIDSTNTALTATGLTIGATTPPTGNGVRVVNNDGTARVVTISNNSIKSAGDAIKTTDGGTAGELSLVLNGNTLETTGVGSLAMNIAGSALNSTTVNSFNGVTVTANGTGGGILFSRVTFDAVTGGAIQQVTGGTANIGQGTAAGQRVQGNGLNFQGPTGDIAFGTLNIFSNNGTGLLVNTKTLGTTFTNLSNTTGVLNTSNGAVMNLDPLTVNLTFTSVTSTNSGTSGVILDAVGGTLALGNVSVSNATAAGLSMVDSSAAVTAGTVTVTTAATGLRFGTNTGSFTATGATNLTGITGTGVNGNAATGTYTFQALTISYTGAGRGMDFRSSNFTSFQTGNLSITGDGTAGSIAIDLSGSLYPGGQPVTNNAPNIKLATGAGQTAAISNVNTGVRLGDGTLGSAGAYLRYGNQTPGNSGSTIAVTAGGATVDTSNLTTVSAFQQGRYEFTGVIFTGQATFEGSNPNFIFVGTNAAGAANGTNPNNRISTATFLASYNSSATLAGKTVIFVNDNVAGIDLGAATLNLGANTTIAGFGNGASILVPGGVQPLNVIGDNFAAGGGNFTDGAGAATVHNNAGVVTATLNTGNTLSNFILGNGGTSISGTSFGTLTVNGMVINNSTGAAVNLDTGVLAGTGFNSVTSGGGTTGISLVNTTGTMNFGSGAISGASSSAFTVDGGSAAITYSGSLTAAAGRPVLLQNITGGSVALSGNINGTSTGILVQLNTGGTFTFSGATKTLSTGTNNAVTLATNTGATINFSGGGLAITTTSGTGFGATGGGTVGVTGTGNTISTTTGNALSMNGVAVATNGAVWQSVSANGAANGITLNNLTGGGVVGVQVTGTGVTAGSGGTIQNTTGAAVSLTALGSLGGGVTLNNVNISGGGGISGTNFGTLAVTNVSLSATNAVALSLTTGAIAAGSTFSVLSSSGSATNGVLLSSVSGAFSATTGTITSATGAAWSVVGGTVASTYSGNITQANNAALLSVTGGHATGTITFNTGTLSATNGTGLQFDNADGTYNFNGTTTLNGGDAGVDILNGSSGTFSFNANTSITNPTGSGLTANGSTANVTYSGNITKSGASAGLLVDVTNESAGTITFQTGTLSSTSTAGAGINLNNADGTVNFNGTTTLNGGNAHVDINTGSGGTVNFGTGASITSPTGSAFVFNGSTAGVTYSGNITQANNALLVSITDQASGTITFQTGTLSATAGTGINLNNVDGTVNFNGTTTLNGGNAHIDINTGSAGTITFGSGASVGATTAPTGVDFREDTSTATVTYNGTLRQTNAANAVSINAKTGGTTTFNGAITANTSTVNAITLTSNTGGTINFTGGLTLTTTSGTGFNATGGGTVSVTGASNTASATTGRAINVVSTTIGASGITFLSINKNGGSTAAINLDTTGAGFFTVTGTGTTAGSGGTLQNIVDADAIRLNNTGGLVTLKNMIIQDITATGDGSAAFDTRSGVDAIQGTLVNGGLTIDRLTIQRISDDGINGTVDGATPGDTVWNGLTITNSTIQNTNRFNVASLGDAQLEAAVYIQGLKGTVVVTGNTFQNAAGGLFLTTDTSGTLDMTVQNNSFLTLYKEVGTRSIGNYGISLVQEGSLTSTIRIGDTTGESNAALGNTFTNGGDLASIRIISENTSTGNLKVSIAKNTFSVTDHSSPGVAPGGQSYNFPQGGVLLRARGTGNYEAIFAANLLNQVMHADGGIGQLSIIAEGGASEFIVRNNTFQLPWDAPVELRADGASGTQTSAQVLFSGNTYIDGTVGDGTTDLGGQSPYEGFYVSLRNGGKLDLTMQNETLGLNDSTSAVNISFYTQTTAHANVFNLFLQNIQSPRGFRLSSNSPTTFNLFRNGSASGTVQGVLQDNGNRGGGGVDTTNPPTVVVTGTINLTNTAPILPNISAPLLVAASSAASASSSNEPLTQERLNTLGAAAISLWDASGITEQQSALLRNVTFGIADLSAGRLGEASGTQILISRTGAGNYWFIDSTPLDSSEFTGSGLTRQAVAGGAAEGRIDLLSVILHEIGHPLGLPDAYGTGFGGPLMDGSLGLGERLLPMPGSALPPTAP